MAKKKKSQNTLKYLRLRFLIVIFATIGLATIPFILMMILQAMPGESVPYSIQASEYLRDDPSDIDVSYIVANNGSAAIVDEDRNIKHLGGNRIFPKDVLTETEWTEFLCSTGKISQYEYSVAYHDIGSDTESMDGFSKSGSNRYWLVIRVPKAVNFSVSLIFNKEAPDYKAISNTFNAFFAVYIIALIIFVVFYSRKAAAELRAMEQVKLEEEDKRMLLVSELSHDLKTPLASVRGYSEMLMKGVSDEEKRQDYLKMIHDNSVRADSILQALFTYSKLGSSGYDPKPEETDLCEFTRLVVAEYISRFEEEGFPYEIDIPEEEIKVKMNTEIFRRVYDNLFENSMKYNKAGTKIGISIAKDGDKVCIRIYDDGVGIPEENRDMIFTPFYRIDGARPKANGGSGLGLAIVKRIVELHDGEIRYESVGGKGCGYKVDLRRI